MGEEIFHINETGGLIGGWLIETGGIQTSDGHLKILAEGSIFATNENGDSIWGLFKSGEATFANGNVLFHADGSAEFTGKITSSSGEIGGWTINQTQLYNAHVLLDNQYGMVVGRFTAEEKGEAPEDNVSFSTFANRGGVKIYYNSSEDWGLVGYAVASAGVLHGSKLFTLGSENTIAGWNFDKDVLYAGTAIADITQFANSGSITLSPYGVFGHKWKLLADGSGKVAGDNIVWDANGKVTFSKDVSLNWETPNEVTQKIAFGNMLYRDPEFLNDVANGTGLYWDWNYITIPASLIQTYATQVGIVYQGTCAILQIDIISTDGTETTVWTGNQGGTTEFVQLTNAISEIVTGEESIRIKFLGQTGVINIVESTYTTEGSDELQYDYYTIYDNGNVDEASQLCHSVTRAYAIDDTVGRENTQVVKYTNQCWMDNSRRLAGFYFANQSYKGSEYIVKIIAQIPVGFMIENYHNAYGIGGTTKWITTQNGTGNYETYICVVKCGTGGTFSTINHFALKCANGYAPADSLDYSDISLAIEETAVNGSAISFPMAFNGMWHLQLYMMFPLQIR